MIKQSPQIVKQVELYNNVIDKKRDFNQNCIVISELANVDDTYFIEDGYHLNEYGSKVLFHSILKYYREIE